MLCYSISLFKRHMVVIAFLSNDTSLLSCPQWIIERETDRERFVNKQLVLSFLLSEKSGEIARDSSRYFYNESHVSSLSFMCTQGFFFKKISFLTLCTWIQSGSKRTSTHAAAQRKYVNRDAKCLFQLCIFMQCLSLFLSVPGLLETWDEKIDKKIPSPPESEMSLKNKRGMMRLVHVFVFSTEASGSLH